jgi:hypothetical protein
MSQSSKNSQKIGVLRLINREISSRMKAETVKYTAGAWSKSWADGSRKTGERA